MKASPASYPCTLYRFVQSFTINSKPRELESYCAFGFHIETAILISVDTENGYGESTAFIVKNKVLKSAKVHKDYLIGYSSSQKRN